MHSLTFHLLADDLTGALDSAAAFAAPVAVHLDRVAAAASDGDPAHPAVVALSIPTRDIARELIADTLGEALSWLARADVSFKKVDSLLRGNTFAECAHLLRSGRFEGAIFAPAFPSQRRVTVNGEQRVVDPDDPSRWTAVAPQISTAFEREGIPVLLSDVPPLTSDGPSVGSAGTTAFAPVWVPNVRTDADLRRVASWVRDGARCRPRWLWCGSAGLAQALAAELRLAPADQRMQAAAAAPRGDVGHVMIGASHHPVVRRQWRHLREMWPDAIQVVEGHADQFDSALEVMSRPYVCAALELSPAQTLSASQAADLLRQQLEQLVSRLTRPQALMVVGGDTLLALCRATGATSLSTAPALRPGWGSAVLGGGVWDGLRVHSRSGAFGEVGDLAQMLAAAMQASASPGTQSAERRGSTGSLL